MSNSLRPHGPWPTRPLCPWNSSGKNTGDGSYSLLQGIFLTQGSNPGPLHCRQILYHLSYQGSPVLTDKEVQGREVRFIAQSPKASQNRADYLEIHIYIYREGNGNPLQCSCLENPMVRGAGWAAVHGVAKSRTWLKRLSSSSIHTYVSSSVNHLFIFHAFYFYSTFNY